MCALPTDSAPAPATWNAGTMKCGDGSDPRAARCKNPSQVAGAPAWVAATVYNGAAQPCPDGTPAVTSQGCLDGSNFVVLPSPNSATGARSQTAHHQIAGWALAASPPVV